MKKVEKFEKIANFLKIEEFGKFESFEEFGEFLKVIVNYVPIDQTTIEF